MLNLFTTLVQTYEVGSVGFTVSYLCGCQPGCILHALAELLETLNETYERTMPLLSFRDAALLRAKTVPCGRSTGPTRNLPTDCFSVLPSLPGRSMSRSWWSFSHSIPEFYED